jgi:MFS family permease
MLPLTSAVTFLGFLDTHLLIPVIALYASGLGAGIGMVGLIVGFYSIVNTPANILFGRLVDKTGYKAPLIGGLTGDAVSMLLYTLTRNPLHLALVRALHGASGALVAPSTMSIIANESPDGRRGRSMSFYGMALAAASLIGYPVSGLIVSRLGFNALFFIGAAMVALGLFLSVLLPGGKGIATGTTRTGGGLRQVRVLLTRKALLPAYATIFAQYFTFGGVVTLLPIHVEMLDMGAYEMGMLLATFSAVFVLTQLPSGASSDRIGRLPPIVAGMLCIAISLVLLPLLSSFRHLAAMMASYGLGYGLLFPSISALIPDHTCTEDRGLATGIFHALLTAGVAIGAPLMGWIGSLMGTGAALVITPIPILLALLVSVLCLRRL